MGKDKLMCRYADMEMCGIFEQPDLDVDNEVTKCSSSAHFLICISAHPKNQFSFFNSLIITL